MLYESQRNMQQHSAQFCYTLLLSSSLKIVYFSCFVFCFIVSWYLQFGSYHYSGLNIIDNFEIWYLILFYLGSQQINKKISMNSSRRRLITISTGDGRWNGKRSCDYLLSLQDLKLEDLLEDKRQKNAQVSINLFVQKVTPFSTSPPPLISG